VGGNLGAAAPGRRLRIARPGTALAVGILTVLMLAATAVLSSMARQPLFDGLSHGLVYLSFGMIGMVVAWHQPRNPMGWVAVLLGAAWAPAIVLAGLSLLLFPDGRIPSARWRSSSPSSARAGWPGWPARCRATGVPPASAGFSSRGC
jgi:hypothetical protein